MFALRVESLNVQEDVEKPGDTKCRYTIKEQVFIKLNMSKNFTEHVRNI